MRSRVIATFLGVVLLPSAALAIDPITNSVNVTATVCQNGGVTPQITDPATSTTVRGSILEVSGTGRSGDIVTLLRDGQAAGTAQVNPGGVWSLPVTLVPGPNILVAFDCAASAPVTVTFIPEVAAPEAGQPASGTQTVPGQVNPAPPALVGVPIAAPSTGPFFLTTDQGSLAIEADQEVVLRASIRGATGPFALRVDWADGAAKQGQQAGRDVVTKHTYSNSGTYTAQIYARATTGEQAALQFVIQVKPTAPALGPHNSHRTGLLSLLLLELLLVMLLFTVWELFHRRHPEPFDTPSP